MCGARAETAGGSRRNFLSGRLEQHVVLSTGHHGLALAELAIQYSNAYMPLSVARDFGDRWGLRVGGLGSLWGGHSPQPIATSWPRWGGSFPKPARVAGKV